MADYEKKRSPGSWIMGRKGTGIALFGAGAILVVLLVGAVVVMGSLLRQFASGTNISGGAALSEYTMGTLIVRDTPVDDEASFGGLTGAGAGGASRTALMASAVIRVYDSTDSFLPDISCFGVVMDENGYILTGAAVARNGSFIEAELYDGRRFQAKLIGYDLKTDVAVIKIDGRNLRTAAFGNGDMTEGDGFIYIGLGSMGHYSISEGVIGGTSGVYIKTPAGYSYLRLTATDRLSSDINTGGAAVNHYGQIVGLRCSYATDNQNFTYAVSINDLRPIIDDIVENGRVSNRFTLGFKGETVGEALALSRNYPRGVLVTDIEANSGLLNAQLMTGDIITAVDGTLIVSADELERTLLLRADEVMLRVFRPGSGDTIEVAVPLMEDSGLYADS